MGESQFRHGVEDAPVHRFQAVPHVREGAGDDNAHRIVEVRTPHLVFDILTGLILSVTIFF